MCQLVVPSRKGPIAEDKEGSPHFGGSSENVFQEVFLADCSTDVFFSEQGCDETAQVNENGNNMAKPPSR